MTETNLKLNQSKTGILTLRLNRPGALNTLNLALLEELEQALEQAKNDPTIKALLLCGEGKTFCAGADIHHLATLNTQAGYAFAKKGQAIFSALEKLGKPSLAAVHGFALGGGCELAMAATLRIAADSATFGQPEVKLGIIPGFGGTQRLARLVGKGRALDLCLSGRLIKAPEALAWGLVSDLTPADNLLAQATSLLETLLKQPPLAMRSIMEVIDCGYDLDLDAALELEATHFGLCCASQDKNEGVSAFLEKRPAQFIGA